MILFGYRKGTGLTQLRELDGSEAAAYELAVSHIRAFDHSSILLHLVRESHAELQRVLALIAKCEPLASDAEWERMHGLEIDFDGRLLSLLAACRMFLDQTDARLKRQYGGDAIQVREFAVAKAAAFDGAFEYRFMYKLRNHIQHAGFPNWSPLVDGTVSNGEVWRIIRMFEPTADPGELISSGGDWGAVVRRDLAARRDRIAIGPAATEFVRLLGVISDRTKQAEEPELRASVQVVDATVALALDRNDYPMVAIEAAADGKRHLTFVTVPSSVMRQYGSRIPDRP